MAIEITLDSLDNVDESERGFFEETEDGKFKLDWSKRDEAIKLPVVKKNKELLGKLSQAKGLEKLEKFKDVTDEDWDSYQQWRESRNGEGDGEGDKVSAEALKKAQARHKDELAKTKNDLAAQVQAKETEAQEWAGKWKNERLTNSLSALAAKHGVFAEDIPEFVEFMRYKRLFDLDEEGKTVFLDEGEVSDVTPELAFKNVLPEKFGRFFEAPTKGGSGTQRSSGGGKKPLKRSVMTPKEKSDYIKEHGNAKFLALPA